MELQYLASAAVLVKTNNVKILCDPWFIDGEYYGSWAHYPPLNFQPEDFNDVDFIYISHIHPDHFSTKTLSKMNKNIPVLIHNYHEKYLKQNIERLGFSVRELEHNKRTLLKNNVHINILAADNCNPELCFKYFGCAIIEKNFGSTSIDSMMVIDDGNYVLVNTNDCPYELANTSAKLIKNYYKKIDMLLVGYTSASAYPQCFELPFSEKQDARNRLKKMYIDYAEKYVNLFEPKFFMPFAGRYTLAGNLYVLNKDKGAYELEEAYEKFISSPNIDHTRSKCIILNSQETFDLISKKPSKNYIPINKKQKENYVEKILSKIKFDYEKYDFPEINSLLELIPKAYEKFELKRKTLGFSSPTKILIELDEKTFLIISCDGNGYKILSKDEVPKFQRYIKMSLDSRLFQMLLKGPKFAIWNNAEIGSHIHYERKPDIYERSLFYCMSYFHS